MPIRWFSEKPISEALAMAAQGALQAMNTFTLTDDNLEEFIATVRGQRILKVGLDGDDNEERMTNVNDMGNDDFQKVADQLLRPLIGFHWHHGSW